MSPALRDGILFVGCVVFPCVAAWLLEEPMEWHWVHRIGAALFVVATVMVFMGLRLLLVTPVVTTQRRRIASPSKPQNTPEPTWTEVIHVEYKESTARVVALLKLGDEVDDLHLLELDVAGHDLRPEVLEQAVRGVASGEPSTVGPAVEKVGYASGWGLTLPCPPLQH